MLEYEWRELETLCERLADLRHRQTFANKSKNVGLMEGLKRDIERVARQREQLVQHISARLGSVSADRPAEGSATANDMAGGSAAGGDDAGPSEKTVGFTPGVRVPLVS